MRGNINRILAAALLSALCGALVGGCSSGGGAPVPETSVNPAQGRPAPNDPATRSARPSNSAR
jgi:hypothetical protein